MTKNRQPKTISDRRSADALPSAGLALLGLLNAQKDEKILDLGCGDGRLTREIKSKSCEVIAIDIDPEMVKKTTKRHIDSHLIDARAMQFENHFDAVFSYSTLHWIKEQETVVKAVARSLKKGGRFVAECAGSGNTTIITTAIIKAVTAAGYEDKFFNPWHYQDAAAYRHLLERHKLSVEFIALIPQLAVIPCNIQKWLDNFTSPFLKHIPPSIHVRIFNDTEKRIQPILCNQKGVWHADYVRLWIIARKV